MFESRRVVPLILVGYNLFALSSLKFFSNSYPYGPYVTLKQLPAEISVRLSRSDEHHEATKPYCPPIVEHDGRAWEQIKHPANFWSVGNIQYDEKTTAQRYGLMNAGGMWKPANCNAVHNVTLVIPYRDRPGQLKKFILHMHPFLQLQMVQYRLMIIEQVDQMPFNRAALFNVGFVESMKHSKGTHCYVFHDVDLLPLHIKNVYGCTQHPRHMSAAINSHRYLLGYDDLFGGAVAITQEQFMAVNGFSNKFFGWGGEDDDFFRRLKHSGIKIVRLSPLISTYRMLPHLKVPGNENRFSILKNGEGKHHLDGINSTNYTVVNHIEGPLYTLIQVAFR